MFRQNLLLFSDFAFSAAAQCEPGDPEAQRHWAGGDVPVQTPQGVEAEQGHGREADQYVNPLVPCLRLL